MKRIQQILAVSMTILVLLGLSAGLTEAQGPLGASFTYQGRLTDGGSPANGTYDFQFKLFNTLSAGTQIGSTNTADNLSVSSGLFVVLLNFGAGAFNGQTRYLEVAVRPGNSSGGYTTLSPRQFLNNSPYALFSSAPWATNALNVNYMQGNVGIGTVAPTSKLEIAAQDGLAITGYQPFLTLRDSNAGNKRGIIQSVNGDVNIFSNSFIGGTSTMILKNTTGNVGIGTATPADKLTVVTAPGNYGVVQTDGIASVGTFVGSGVGGGWAGWFGTKTNHPLRFFTNNTGAALSIDTTNKVGIGTISPSAQLSVLSPGGTLPLTVRQNAAESATPGLAVFETSNGTLGYVGANTGALIVGGSSGKALGLNVNNTTRGITIASNGRVGIGTTNMGAAQLTVKSPNTGGSTGGLVVYNGDGNLGFWVGDDGAIGLGSLFNGGTGSHICLMAGAVRYFSTCGSAAEYVPTIDAGLGFPDTADLVSIAPGVVNPYDDTHGPFVVTKSARACDDNLLGFLAKREFGADGMNKNEHYLPLAIYGYFPAKVTIENGAIKRGDPLTSSSKPGYAMKATDACKIIGYALDDANAEGTIQVFANTGESAAPAVATLQKQMQEKDAQIAELKQQNAALDERLATLEQVVSGERGTTTAFNTNWLVVGGLVLAGMVFVYRNRKDKRI